MTLVPVDSIRRPEAQDLIKTFLESKDPDTIKNYSISLRDFAQFLGKSSPGEMARDLFAMDAPQANWVVLKFRNQLEQEKLAPSTINSKLTAVRSLVALARIMGLVSWEIEIDGLKSKAYRDTRGPGEDGVRKILSGITGNSLRDLRDRAIIHLAFDMGLRREEIATLDLEHVKEKLWVMGKKRKEREGLTIPQPTAEVLIAWIQASQPTGPVFFSLDRAHFGHRLNGGSIWRIVVGRAADVEIETSTHGLRHAAITYALDLTGDVRKVAKFARHGQVSTTMIYDDNRQDLGGEVSKLVAGEQDGQGVAVGAQNRP